MPSHGRDHLTLYELDLTVNGHDKYVMMNPQGEVAENHGGSGLESQRTEAR